MIIFIIGLPDLLPCCSICRTTFIPCTTEPKTTCLLSNQSQAAVVMKNWLPFVFGPAFAMDNIPGQEFMRIDLFRHRFPEFKVEDFEKRPIFGLFPMDLR
uniref:Uncharacterized protein n=1 Tax=Romanomermis culicivorax TaxID=13658 RepID=A0A915I0D6_ROMCU